MAGGSFREQELSVFLPRVLPVWPFLLPDDEEASNADAPTGA
jgi:hypothetical protein